MNDRIGAEIFVFVVSFIAAAITWKTFPQLDSLEAIVGFLAFLGLLQAFEIVIRIIFSVFGMLSER